MNVRALPEHTRGILAVSLAALLWSTGGIFIKLIPLDALTLSGLRSVFASLVFLCVFRKQVFTVNLLSLVNATLYACILISFVIATKKTTAANAIFLQYTAPIYVLLLEPFLLKTRLERINLLTIAFCFLGMTLFFVGELSPGHLEGNLIALLSGLTFAGFLLGQRKNQPQYQAGAIFWGNILIALVCLPFAHLSPLTPSVLLMSTYLGIVQIGLAYAIFTYGLKRVLAVEGALIAMIEPVLNPVWVFLGYGEMPSPLSLAGGFIILTAITLRSIFVERLIASRSRSTAGRIQ